MLGAPMSGLGQTGGVAAQGDCNPDTESVDWRTIPSA